MSEQQKFDSSVALQLIALLWLSVSISIKLFQPIFAHEVVMEIEVVRPKQFADIFRDYHLLVDGKEAAVIKRGATQTITLPEGSKTLKAVIDWCSSPDFYVSDIRSGKIVVKNAFSSNFFKSLFLPLYYITLGKERYLKIEAGI